VFGVIFSLVCLGDQIPTLGWIGVAVIVTSGVLATVLRTRLLPPCTCQERSGHLQPRLERIASRYAPAGCCVVSPMAICRAAATSALELWPCRAQQMRFGNPPRLERLGHGPVHRVQLREPFAHVAGLAHRHCARNQGSLRGVMRIDLSVEPNQCLAKASFL